MKKAEHWRIDTFELWCWRRLLRVPWTARRSNQSILKEISPGISLEGNDAKAETPVLWPPHVKSWLIGKDSDAGRDWGQEEKGMTEDEMAGWRHQLDGHEFEWTLGVGDGQGDLACCDSWGRKESDTTERLNWTEPIPSRTYRNEAIENQSQKEDPKSSFLTLVFYSWGAWWGGETLFKEQWLDGQLTSSATMKARSQENNIFKMLRGNHWHLRIVLNICFETIL